MNSLGSSNFLDLANSLHQCAPANRVWPSKCDRCIGLNLDCSPPEDLREKTAGLTITPHSPRIDNVGKIIKIPRTPRTATTSSGSPITAGRLSEEILATLIAPLAYSIPDYPDKTQGLSDSCEQCKPLGLSPDRFLVPDRSRRHGGKVKFGRAAGQHFLGKGAPASEHFLDGPGGFPKARNVQQRVLLGTLGRIRSRCWMCKFCNLVWWSAADQLLLIGETAQRLDQCNQEALSAYATWEIDGRELVPFTDTFFYQPVTRHIRLSWETTKADFKPNDAYVVLCGDNPNTVGLDHAFLGRRVKSAEGSGLDYDTMKGWIKHCDIHHGSCRPHTLPHILALQFGDHRVVEVTDREVKLVPMREEMEYVVLSYTWSSDETLLRMGDYKPWHESGMDESRLSQDIRRAIELVRGLGKRYLWVDSLCIVQDDLGDKKKHYHVMNRIVANASLTICAARSSKAAAGVIRQHIIEYGKVSLMVHHPLETYIRNSDWAKGAWTSQDRLLSGRCLILTDTAQVWFQCQEESMSQDIFESSFQGYSADMVQNPVQIWNELSVPSSRYRAYVKAVELYTSRRLPFPEHALRAFGGISNFLGTAYGTQFISGLPSSFLDMALLWTPTTSDTERRRTADGRPVAPSWSWASWTGQATYRSPILTGAIENIRGWLEEHTWITWYLADYKGRLGQIGPFATGKLEDRIEDRGPSPSEPPKRESRWPSRNQTLFFKTVKEPKPDPDEMHIDETDINRILGQQYFLQFWTWSAFFQLVAVPPENSRGQSPPDHHVSTPTIRRFNILDCNSDICGTIMLPNEFAEKVEREQADTSKTPTFEFIALSDAKLFRDTDEMKEWTYYIPKERADSFWDLAYVLLIEDDIIADVSRRVGLGKVFKDAFHQSLLQGMQWKEFILA